MLLYALVSAAALGLSFEVPPLVAPPSTEHHAGKVIWVDLLTPDIAAAKQFYAGLFGWTFQDIKTGDSNYAIASLGGRPVGGLFQRKASRSEDRRSAWLGFIAVTDVDGAEKNAVAHGAKLLKEPRTYAQRGRQAVLADPEGAVFAMLASSSGDPADELADPGEWIWSSVHVNDPDKEAAFYQTVFGYDVFDADSDAKSDSVILSSDDFARASVNALPKDMDTTHPRHPHWLNFVRVTDADSAAAKAVALGGRVLLQPRPDKHGGKLAIIADPAGAVFGVMEWSDTDSTQEPKQ
jgi:predicted enzyme related to lactoylglutathione lyase